jgi:hypothetical protein
MWLSVGGSILIVGASFFLVYFCYSKMRHPDLITTSRRRLPDFIQVYVLFRNHEAFLLKKITTIP